MLNDVSAVQDIIRNVLSKSNITLNCSEVECKEVGSEDDTWYFLMIFPFHIQSIN